MNTGAAPKEVITANPPGDQRQEGVVRKRAAEWGEYMAVGAERLLDAINALDRAEEGEGTGPDEDAAIEHAEQALTEAMTGLRSDVYEFRKRAASPPPEAAAAVGDRKRFEHWAGSQGLRLAVRDRAPIDSSRHGQYCADDTQLAWKAYRAALASPTGVDERDS